MKTRFLPGLLVALSMFVSCISELRDPELSKSEIVFTAMTEPQMDSRTSIEAGTQVYWEPDDKITVFSGSRSGRFVSRLSAPVATASFYGSMEGWSSAAEVLALYPESEDAVCTGGLITTMLPSRQYARTGSFAQGTNLAVARSSGRTLQFYNVGGGVRFTLAEEGIKKVVFESLGDEWLAGKVKVGFEDGRPRVLEVSEGSRYITLIPPDGETFETGKWYYIVAIPGALESGYKLKFYKDEVYAQRVSETSVTIKRSIYGSIENADAGLEYEPIPNLTEWTTDKTMRGVQYAENGGGEGGEGGEGETGEIVNMPPNALFVMDDLNDLLQSFDDQNWTITYNDGPALTEADIKVGDVLYSMPVGDIAPEGYILRVTGIRKEGDRVVYDVEPAGLADAFDELNTTIPLDEVPLTEDCFTVYDPFDQPDWDTLLDEAMPGPTIQTRSLVDWMSNDPDVQLKSDRCTLKIEEEKSSLDILLVDGDDDLKTKDDQLRLILTLEHEFNDFHVSFKDFHLSGYGAPEIGINAKLRYKDENEFGSSDTLTIMDYKALETQYKRKERMRKMEQKLVGKKIKLVSWKIPTPSGCKIFIDPRFDFYVFFTMNLDGQLEATVGLEKKPMEFSFGNNEDDCTLTDEKTTKFSYKPTAYYSLYSDLDLKATAGVGAGFVVGLSKVLSKVAYKNTYPFIGVFFEYAAHFDAKVKMGFKNEYAGDKTYSVQVTADYYTDLKAYLEGDFRFKNNLFFQFKVEALKIRLPEKGQKQLDTTFSYIAKYPTAMCVSPENGGVGEAGSVELEWEVPTPSVGDRLSHFIGLSYDVYASTNKDAVETMAEGALVASRLSEKRLTVNTGQGLETWYWRVVIHNSLDCQFNSPVFRFDTGYDGEIKLTQGLIEYLTDNYETVPDLRILQSGKILRTPSNLAALRAVEELYINDPENKYWVIDINPLLAEMTNITHLNCGYNRIKSLDLSANRKLKNLTCRNNELESLNITGLSLLESINCAENFGIEVLDVASCPKLGVLTCSKCQIEELDLSACQKITDLFAAENYLDSLDISHCPNLIRLDVYAQHKERLKLRLMRRQYEGFALFKRHVNMDFEFAENVMTGDPVRLTQTSATIPVAYRVEGDVLQCGVVYSIDEKELKISTAPVEYGHGWEAGTYSVTLEGLLPDTEYRARGFVLASGESSICYGNVIRFKTLPGDGVPVMAVSPQYIEFGEVEIGDSLTKPFRIFNKGDGPLVFHLEGDSPFSWSPEGEITIPAYGDEEVFVTFTPYEGREWEDIIRIVSNASEEAFEFQVNGIGVGETPFSVEAIDLGLPSGIQWANANVGAQSKTDIGSLFAWGETETKDKYLQSNYAWYDGGYTKYCFEPGNGANGFTDQKGVLELEDDAARAHWKEPWRTPSREEWQELIDHCEWAADTLQRVPCVRGTSKTTGNSIWFPVSERTYWSSSLYVGKNTTDYETRINSRCVYALSFSFKGTGVVRTDLSYDTHWRYNGYPVRPVRGTVNEIRLDRQSLSLKEGSLATLRASVYPASAPNQSVRWHSSDESVAFVSSEGIVYGLHPGTVTVTAYSVEGNVPASCEVTVLPGVVHDPVDLGLSVKWASRDIGASQAWTYGVPYRWAETVPYHEGTAYRWARDKMWTKYNEYDKRTVLELSDDAAFQAWGDHWRTPSREEWQELLDNCTQIYLKIGAIEIIQLVSKKNGGAICFVLPFSQNWSYWTSSIGQLGKESVPCCFSSLHGGSRPYFDEDSSYGASCLVRAVYDEVFHFPVTGISLNRTALKMTEGGSSSSLDARVWPNNASDQRFTWSSSDPSIVSVSAEGQLKALRPGRVTVTAQTAEGGFRASCQVTVGPAPKAVDLGLSVLWASCDVGADAPEEGGIGFRWGETAEPEPDQPDWIYQWFLEDNYTTPGKMLMDPCQDPATVCLGGGWRTPTRAEWEELMNRQNCAWTIENGCCVITSKKTGNTVRIPVGDHRTNELSKSGVSWTYSLNTQCEFLKWMCSFAIRVRAVINAADVSPGSGNEGVTTGDDIPM